MELIVNFVKEDFDYNPQSKYFPVRNYTSPSHCPLARALRRMGYKNIGVSGSIFGRIRATLDGKHLYTRNWSSSIADKVAKSFYTIPDYKFSLSLNES